MRDRFVADGNSLDVRLKGIIPTFLELKKEGMGVLVSGRGSTIYIDSIVV
jgi:hypothetical protein